jgi:CPA2 family monovalent cation:H+ antiporter-2
MIGRLLEAEHIDYVALDTSAEVVSAFSGADRKTQARVYFGDASRAELLKRVGAERARAIVLTLDSTRAAERAIAAMRTLSAATPIFARAKDVAHARRLAEAGVLEVVPEAVEASLQLGGRVLESLGVPEEMVATRIDAARKTELSRLVEQGPERS